MMGVLYCSGLQNGSTAIAYRAPMMETGIVEPSMDTRTDENYMQWEVRNTVARM